MSDSGVAVLDVYIKDLCLEESLGFFENKFLESTTFVSNAMMT